MIKRTKYTDEFLKFKLQHEYLLEKAGVNDESEREQLLRVFYRYGHIVYPEEILKKEKDKLSDEYRDKIANLTNKLIEVLNELDDIIIS